MQRYLLLVTAALIGTLPGCLGGSGSSGFDITENAAIQEAIDTQQCQDFEGLLICPAETIGIPAPSPSPTPTPTFTPPNPTTPPAIETPTMPDGTPSNETVTPTAIPSTPSPTITRAIGTPTTRPTPSTPVPMQVVTSLNESSDIVCAGGEGSACSFAFFFVASGFPDTAAYRTAQRASESQSWSISEPVALDAQAGQATYRADVQFETPADAPAAPAPTIQFAVLVFLSEPASLPPSVTLLGETGANFAYVLPAVPISQ